MLKTQCFRALYEKHACFGARFCSKNLTLAGADTFPTKEAVNEDLLKCCTKDAEEKETASTETENSTSKMYKYKDWKVWWSSGTYGSHPGKCMLTCVSIPNQLNISAGLYLKDYNKEVLKTVADKLNNLLWSRKVFKDRQSLFPDVKKKAKYVRVDGNIIDLAQMTSEEYRADLKIEKRFLAEKRKFEYNWKQLNYDDINSAAFLISRSPACYASSLHVMNEIKTNVPDFKPFSMLDFGSGTGMCVWAANSLWKDSIKQYFCVDASKQMNDLAFYLFTGGNYDKVLPGLFIRQSLPVSFQSGYDIVISAYSLSELPTEKERLTLLKLLWEKTDRFLILIENGNFFGYYIMMEARNLLLNGMEGVDNKKAKKWSKFKEPASVFSPCPHSLDCPKWGENSCTFAQKYFRPAYYRTLNKKIEDSVCENFSYIVFEKGVSSVTSQQRWPRVVDDPHCKPSCATCHLCTPMGTIEHIAVKKATYGKDLYYITKKSVCGDSLPLTPRNGHTKN